MKWYKLSNFTSDEGPVTIEAVEVERETTFHLVLAQENGRTQRVAKGDISTWHSYHRTYTEAQQTALERRRRECDQHRRKVSELETDCIRIAGMKEKP